MYLRPILPQDREPLADLLRRTDNFTAEEVDVALELIDESIRRPEQSGYRCLVALKSADNADDDRYLGYTCYGHTPMTESTYDLYWIVVDPEHRKQGVGRQLLLALFQTLQHAGGHTVRVETSSMESYGGTMKFYLREGFQIAGRIPSFYKQDDDLVILFYPL